MLQAPTWVVMLVKSAFTPIKIVKGAGLFQRAGRTKEQAGGQLWSYLFWMMQNDQKNYQLCFFVKTVKYLVYFLDLSVTNHERLVR